MSSRNRRCATFLCVMLLCCYVTKVSGKSIDYNWVSKTNDGAPCLNTCTGGKCYVDHHLNQRDCTTDRLAGVPIYLTTFSNGDFTRCLSNCGRFGGYDYEWCYTTEYYDWDYCNSAVRSPSERNGRTPYGEKCIDECDTNGYSSSRCHIDTQEFKQCAPPARVPVKSCLNIFSDSLRNKRSPALDRIFSASECTQICRDRYRDGRNGEVQERINRVYTPGIYNVENVTSFAPGSPYTFVATANATNAMGDTVLLPLIVQATIRRPPAAIRVSGDVPDEASHNVANMYDNNNQGIDTGHIVAFVNGGSRDLFNFVGQTRALNRGPYKVIENFINSWITFGGYVEFTAVMEYAGTRPDEFAVKVKFYNADGSLHSDCLDIILKNN